MFQSKCLGELTLSQHAGSMKKKVERSEKAGRVRIILCGDTAMKRLYSVSLWATVVYAVSATGCSSQAFLSAPVVAGKQAQLNEGAVKNGDGRGREDDDDRDENRGRFDDDEREWPPIEVAGSNLVGECYALEDGPRDSADGRVDCTVTSSDGPREVFAHTAKMLMADTVWTGVTSGRPTGVANTYSVSAAVPLSASFVVPKDTIAAMDERSVRVTFAAFGVGGQEPRQDFEMRMKVRKKQLRADANCGASVSLTRSSGAPANSPLSLLPIPWFAFTATPPVAIGCDYAFEFTGADLKGTTKSGLVFIKDATTNQRWLLFSQLGITPVIPTPPPPGIPWQIVELSASGVDSRRAPCRNRSDKDDGKWICSDYLNIFAEDLGNGNKVIEVLSSDAGFDPKAFLKPIK